MMTNEVCLAKMAYFIKGVQEEYKSMGRIDCDVRFEALRINCIEQLKFSGLSDTHIEELAYACVKCGCTHVRREMIHLTYPLELGKGSGQNNEMVEVPYSTEAVTCLKCNHFWSDWNDRDQMFAIMKYVNERKEESK